MELDERTEIAISTVCIYRVFRELYTKILNMSAYSFPYSVLTGITELILNNSLVKYYLQRRIEFYMDYRIFTYEFLKCLQLLDNFAAFIHGEKIDLLKEAFIMETGVFDT